MDGTKLNSRISRNRHFVTLTVIFVKSKKKISLKTKTRKSKRRMKLKVLEWNRKLFVWMWVLPSPPSESIWKRLRYFALGMSCCFFVTTSLMAGAVFAYQLYTININLALYGLFQVSAYGSQVYLSFLSFIIWRKFVQLYVQLQEVYDDSECISKLPEIIKTFAKFRFFFFFYQSNILIHLTSWKKLINVLNEIPNY